MATTRKHVSLLHLDGFFTDKEGVRHASTDASDLGFFVGEWPDILVAAVPKGDTWCFLKHVIQLRKGSCEEVEKVMYACTREDDTVFVLTVLND